MNQSHDDPFFANSSSINGIVSGSKVIKKCHRQRQKVSFADTKRQAFNT
jgi:hypothetical protein